MPTYRFIDYNPLESKPNDVDVFAIYDIDLDELKKISYAALKSFFVKTDEPTDIEAILEFQSTVTKPNSILKFGSAGEFRIYSDGTPIFMKGTNAAGKLRFYANSLEIFTLDPVNNSMATYGNAINYDGTAGEGLKFDSSNRAEFSKRVTFDALIYADAGIKLTLKNISYSGAVDTGLEFDVSNNAYIKQTLYCEDNANITGNLNVTGQINANKIGNYSIEADGSCYLKGIVRIGDWLNKSGSAAKGMNMSSGDNATFSEKTVFSKGLQTTSSTGNIECWGSAKFIHSGNNGWTGTINLATDNTILVSGGIIYGKT
jgi:hypothetical protein